MGVGKDKEKIIHRSLIGGHSVGDDTGAMRPRQLQKSFQLPYKHVAVLTGNMNID